MLALHPQMRRWHHTGAVIKRSRAQIGNSGSGVVVGVNPCQTVLAGLDSGDRTAGLNVFAAQDFPFDSQITGQH